MDPQRFDRITRDIGARKDRRQVFKTVAAGALATFGLGAVARQSRAAGRDGDSCSSSADCETGLICDGASNGLLGGIIADGNYGPPAAASLFGPSDGKCRYRGGDNCAKSDQYCKNNSDCCNGLNLECHNNKCRRR